MPSLNMPLSIIAIGDVHAEDLMTLGEHFTKLEQLVLDVHPRVVLNEHRAELNRAMDASSSDWVLIVRERELVDAALAKEIAEAIGDTPRAWGFRIRSVPYYDGKPLLIGEDAGELRLFHRRHLLRRGDLNVQGTVIRLTNVLRSITFASPAEHLEYLGKSGVPHSSLRRLLLFVHHVIVTRTLDRNTLRYLWIEAGFDHAS